MKKILSLISIIAILATSMFALSGCGNAEGENNGKNGDNKKADTVDISTEFFKGTLKFSVPKKEDGTAKYEFTKDRPESLMKYANGTLYLETDKAIITIASKGWSYNTGKEYKSKYGDKKASFDGYVEFMNDPTSTVPKNGVEMVELNGRKAVKRQSKQGSASNYTYYGFQYMVEADDVMPGSYVELGVYYKGEEEHKSSYPIDEETQAILDTYSLKLNS